MAAGLELRWDAKSRDGSWPAKVNLVAPSISVGGRQLPITPEATAPLTAKFDAYTKILAVQTPSVLQDIGIDLTQALLGLTIPMPGGSAAVGTSWVVPSTTAAPGKGFNVRATYTLVEFAERRGATLASIRGNLVLTPRDGSTNTSYTGYLEAFVDPASGRVLESGMSLDIISTLPLPKANSVEEASAHAVITAYLLDLGPSSATAPAPLPAPVKPVPAKPATVPVVSVDQPGIAISRLPDTVSDSTELSELPPGVPAPQPAVPGNRVLVPTDTNSLSDDTTIGTTANASAYKKADTLAATPTPMAFWSDNATNHTYIDPAARFTITLPNGWPQIAPGLSADTTAFPGANRTQMLYVFVGPSGGESLAEYARAVLNRYARSTPQFRLTTDLTAAQMAGIPALSATYSYPDTASAVPVGEIALFARFNGQNYVLLYTDASAKIVEQNNTIVAYLQQALQFGPSPSGIVPADTLETHTWTRYVDPQQRFSLNVPALWPAASQSDDNFSVTFAELGKKGYLTVYLQPSVSAFTADSILAAWRSQWAATAPGYAEISGVSATLLGGADGAELQYEWINSDGRKWRRHIQAAIYQGTLYAVSIDYLSTEFGARAAVFDRIFAGFRLSSRTNEPALWPSAPAELPSTSVSRASAIADAPAVRSGGVVTGAGHAPSTASVRLDEPLDGHRALLAGRLGMRLGGEIRWLSGVVLRIKAGQSLYATRTDSQGYFAFANIAPLSSGSYSLVDVDGLVPGYSDPVAISFSGVQIPGKAGLYSEAGNLVMEKLADGSIGITITQVSAADPQAAARHLLATYPQSGWALALQTAIYAR